MKHTFFIVIFLLCFCSTHADSFEKVLDSLYVIQCKTIPDFFRNQVNEYDSIRRNVDVRKLLFMNVNKNNTIVITELYRAFYYLNYSIKWRNEMSDYVTYSLYKENNKNIIYKSMDTEESLLPLKILNLLQEENFEEIRFYAMEKEKLFHSDSYFLFYAKIIFKGDAFVIHNRWIAL